MAIKVKEWTEQEKKEMIQAVDFFHDYMKHEGFDAGTKAMILSLMSEEYQKEQAIEKIFSLTKSGGIDNPNQWKRLAGIINGLTESEINLIVWRPDPEVLFQFYLGIYLNKPTYILIKDEDMESLTPHRNYSKIKGVHVVKDFSEENLKKAIMKIEKVVGDENGK